MNKLSRKILCGLDDNSRSKLSKIAKKLRTSQQMVSYTIKQMIKKKEIIRFTTVFDYSRFNLHSYIVLFRIFYRKKQDFNQFINNLKNTNELINLEILEGKFDVYTMFLAKNPSQFNKILRKIKSDNKKVLRNDTIITTIVTYTFRRNYLLESKSFDRDYYIVGGDRDSVELTQNQKQVSQCLFNNPRERKKDISKKTGLSFLTITNAIKSLKDNGTIRGFKPVIAFRDSLNCRKILIKYQDFTPEIEDKLVRFCKENINIIHLVKTFGEWDLILTVESLKKKEFDKFLLSLRENFEDMIQDFEIIKVLSIEEEKYLPKDYFNTKEQ